MSSEPMGERVTALETWVKGHEMLCAQRYGDLKKVMDKLVWGVIGVAFGVIAWLAVQLWQGRNYAPPPQASAVVVQQPTVH